MTSVIVEPIHRLAIGPGDEVAVGIHVDPDGVVAHPVLYVGQGLAVRDQPRGEGVPKIMETVVYHPKDFRKGEPLAREIERTGIEVHF